MNLRNNLIKKSAEKWKRYCGRKPKSELDQK